jgi:hypothetical protein
MTDELINTYVELYQKSPNNCDDRKKINDRNKKKFEEITDIEGSENTFEVKCKKYIIINNNISFNNLSKTHTSMNKNYLILNNMMLGHWRCCKFINNDDDTLCYEILHLKHDSLQELEKNKIKVISGHDVFNSNKYISLLPYTKYTSDTKNKLINDIKNKSIYENYNNTVAIHNDFVSIEHPYVRFVIDIFKYDKMIIRVNIHIKDYKPFLLWKQLDVSKDNLPKNNLFKNNRIKFINYFNVVTHNYMLFDMYYEDRSNNEIFPLLIPSQGRIILKDIILGIWYVVEVITHEKSKYYILFSEKELKKNHNVITTTIKMFSNSNKKIKKNIVLCPTADYRSLNHLNLITDMQNKDSDIIIDKIIKINTRSDYRINIVIQENKIIALFIIPYNIDDASI